jgi:hypothetical protein
MDHGVMLCLGLLAFRLQYGCRMTRGHLQDSRRRSAESLSRGLEIVLLVCDEEHENSSQVIHHSSGYRLN